MAGPPPVPGRRPDGDPLPPRRRRPRPSAPPRAPRRDYAAPAATKPPPARTGPPRRPRPRLLRNRVVLAIAGVLAIALVWFLVSLFQPFHGSGGSRVTVVIPRGSSVSKIAGILSKDGVISSSFFFEARATIGGDRGSLKAGTYTNLRRDMSYSAVLTALEKGPPLNVVVVVVPEGDSRREIARSLAGKLSGDYLQATKRSPLLDPASYGAKGATDLEGFLFPSSYQVKRGGGVDALVAKQLAAFKQQFARVDMSTARQHNLTPYDVLTIASMVEREAKVQADRPLVASVIYNRLRAGMPLQIDATTRFLFDDWTHPLTQTQLASPSPYNTRVHVGLPPGPIGNPGVSSLQAAAHPTTTTFLYYVDDPAKPGYLCFASTAAAFGIDQQRYNEARNGGHPPAGCA
jgi:UPF0755 protein